MQEAPQGPTDIRELVSGINGGLVQLMNVMDQSQGVVSDQDKQALGQIVNQFQGFVETLGQAPGGQPAPQPAGAGVAPMETSGRPAKPAL